MSVFPLGTRVAKKSGSSWQGRVCGHYSTALTPDGVCVESEREPGSVQNYPAHAMELVDPAARPDTPQVNVCGETKVHPGHGTLICSRRPTHLGRHIDGRFDEWWP